jgi:signal transduction histidine kinase
LIRWSKLQIAIVLVTAAGILLFAGIVATQLWRQHDRAIAMARNNAIAAAQAAELNVVQVLEAAGAQLDMMAAVIGVEPTLAHPRLVELQDQLWSRRSAIPAILGFFVIDVTGYTAVARVTDVSLPSNHNNRDYFTVPRDGYAGRMHVARSMQFDDNAAPALPVSREIVTTGGEFRGVVAGLLSPRALATAFRDIAAGPDMTVCLVGDDGNVLARHPVPVEGVSTQRRVKLPDLHVVPHETTIVENVIGPCLGERGLIAVRFVRELPICIIVEISRRAVLAPWLDALIDYGIAALLASALIAAMAGMLIRRTRDQERAITALAAARERAEIANASKNRFLATMSHELRTPLNAVIGFSEMIERRTLGETPRAAARYIEYARDISMSGRQLLALLTDILDLSKVESDKLELAPETVDVCRIVDQVVALMSIDADAARVAVAAARPDTPIFARIDPVRIRQVLMNLISNAIKFNRAGGRVEVTLARAQGDIEMAVIDTGIGIAARDIPRALEPFGRVDSAMTPRTGGSGLGLPIAKRLVELHGGTLTIESEVGVGTRIAVRLPGVALTAAAE